MEADRNPQSETSKTFLIGECYKEQVLGKPCPFRDGVCEDCGLRREPYKETQRMAELHTEIKAGLPLERDQVGIYELEVLAMLNERDRAQLAMAASMGSALRG